MSEQNTFVVKAVQSYKTKKKGELAFKKNQLIQVTNSNEAEFLYYGHFQGKNGLCAGWFPYFYVKSTGMVLQKSASEATATAVKEKIHASMVGVQQGKDSAEDGKKDNNKKPTTKKREVQKKVKSDSTEATPAKKGENTQKITQQYVLKSGMLSKRSQEMVSNQTFVWKQYWFVIRTSNITYYKSAVDKKPLGKVSIENVKSVSIENGLKGPPQAQYCFAVNTAKKKHALVLSTPTLSECEEWMSMIEFAKKGGKPVNAAAGILKQENVATPTPSNSNNANNHVKLKEIKDPSLLQLKSDAKPEIKVIRSKDLQQAHSLFELYKFSSPIESSSSGGEEFDSINNLIDIEEKVKTTKGLAKVRAIEDYIGYTSTEFSFYANDEWVLIEKLQEEGWWYGYMDGRYGHFPSHYVKLIDDFKENPDKDQYDLSEFEEELSVLPLVYEPKKPPPKPATEIKNYLIDELLGMGRFGPVYRAFHPDTGDLIAVKQIHHDRVNRKELRNILSELNLLRALNHQNIVKYRGFAQTADHLNVIFDFVEGFSLTSILQKFGPMRGDTSIPYIRQILEGLLYLHSNNVVHNNLKCANILVSKAGNIAKLTDFAINSLEGNTDQSILCGSPHWMAPEVVQLKAPTPPSDIWSLGCTVIELLTGKPPNFELNKMEVLFSIIEKDIKIPKGISPIMEDFLKKCFNKELELRPTAKELLNHALFQGGAIHDEDETEDKESESDEVITETVEDSSELNDEENENDNDNDNEEEESEDDIQFRKLERDTREFLGWFYAAMNKGNVSHSVRIRKTARNKLKQLKKLKADQRYLPLIKDIRAAITRCETEMGEHIPPDSDDDEEEDFGDSDSDFSCDFEEDEELEFGDI